MGTAWISISASAAEPLLQILDEIIADLKQALDATR